MRQKIDFTSLRTIVFFAFIIRIVAAIFSQGYGMHDDHFLIVEAAGFWVDGYDYNHWLPWSELSTGQPEGHSFTYVGINYLYFWCLKALGIADPKVLMLFSRLLHAAFSLLIVIYSFKITEKISTKQNAVIVGWLLALLWVLPFLSVRNLVEIACIPWMLWGIWLTLKSDRKYRFLYAGLLLGMAISFRYQVAVFALGMAAVYFFQRQYRHFFQFSVGVVVVFILTQGVVDFIIWERPFAEFWRYATYNVTDGPGYIPNHNITMYLLVLMGAFLAPLGIALGIGFFTTAKKYYYLFVPVAAFILFHTVYPSKQERFILPVLPLFCILGVVGIMLLVQKSDGWKKFWRISWKSFWVLNIPLLLFASFTYTKKSRVEAMYYFYGKDTQNVRVLYEATGETDVSMLPQFYAGNWELMHVPRTDVAQPLAVHEGYNYAYILFFGEENLGNRVANYHEIYPQMERVKICAPSYVDVLLRWLNPRNRNEYIEIWKTNHSKFP